MPPSVRLGDVCTGHGCYGSRSNDQGSPDVIVNGLPKHRVGDHWVTHCCGPACHDSTQASGSPDVITNGSAAARVGDDIACGSSNQQGSPDVIIN